MVAAPGGSLEIRKKVIECVLSLFLKTNSLPCMTRVSAELVKDPTLFVAVQV